MVSGDPGSRRCFCSVYFYWGFVHSGGLKCSTPKISIARVGQESRTNTKKYQTQKPQKFKSEGQARRIRKASSAKASKAQVGRAGRTNTKKLRVQKPQKLKSEGQARRIRKSFECKSLKSSSRTGRPDEYEKAPGTKLPMYKPKRQAVKTMYPINYNIELITHMNYKVFDS